MRNVNKAYCKNSKLKLSSCEQKKRKNMYSFQTSFVRAFSKGLIKYISHPLELKKLLKMALCYLLPSCVDEKEFAFRPTPTLYEKMEGLWKNSLIPLSNIKLTTEWAYRNFYFVFFDTFFRQRGIKYKDRLKKKRSIFCSTKNFFTLYEMQNWNA